VTACLWSEAGEEAWTSGGEGESDAHAGAREVETEAANDDSMEEPFPREDGEGKSDGDCERPESDGKKIHGWGFRFWGIEEIPHSWNREKVGQER
jgi:hypothetical protein